MVTYAESKTRMCYIVGDGVVESERHFSAMFLKGLRDRNTNL